jgi:hypothetical protein
MVNVGAQQLGTFLHIVPYVTKTISETLIISCIVACTYFIIYDDCKGPRELSNFFFFYFLQIYNLLYKLSNKQICYKETLVRSNHPMMILLCILYVMLCVRLLFYLSLVL